MKSLPNIYVQACFVRQEHVVCFQQQGANNEITKSNLFAEVTLASLGSQTSSQYTIKERAMNLCSCFHRSCRATHHISDKDLIAIQRTRCCARIKQNLKASGEYPRNRLRNATFREEILWEGFQSSLSELIMCVWEKYMHNHHPFQTLKNEILKNTYVIFRRSGGIPSDHSAIIKK